MFVKRGYIKQSQLEAKTFEGQYRSWRLPPGHVGTAGTLSLGLNTSSQWASSKKKSFSVEVDAEMTIGVTVIGGGLGTEWGTTYTVSIQKEQEFYCDIASVKETKDQYWCGLLVYNHGIKDDGERNTATLPFHVVNYYKN